MTQLKDGKVSFDLSCGAHKRRFLVVEKARVGGAIVPAVRMPCGCVTNMIVVEISEWVGDEWVKSSVTRV